MLVDVETVLTGHGEATVRVRGELDLESADQLRHVVTDLLNSGGTTVIGLDLGELTFVDSTGIGTLVVARRICDQVGVTLRIIAISPFVAHVLNITGVSEQFGVAGLISARNVPA